MTLNCRFLPPRPGPSRNKLSQDEITDMCYIEGKDKELVIVFKDGRVRAFDIYSSEIQWEAKQEIPNMEHLLRAGSVTTDGRGHLFLLDLGNKRVQMLSENGDYVRSVAIDRKDEPYHIRWLNKYSSLVSSVMQESDNRFYISPLRLQNLK